MKQDRATVVRCLPPEDPYGDILMQPTPLHFQARRTSCAASVARSHRRELDSDSMRSAVARGREVHRPLCTVRRTTPIRLVPCLSERSHAALNPLPGLSPCANGHSRNLGHDVEHLLLDHNRHVNSLETLRDRQANQGPPGVVAERSDTTLRFGREQCPRRFSAFHPAAGEEAHQRRRNGEFTEIENEDHVPRVASDGIVTHESFESDIM